LYLTSPQMRGADVASLQDLLARLGFDCGRVDGILGPHSIRALTDFQTNYGLDADGICGPETLRALDRVIGHGGDGPGIVTVREYEELLRGDFFGAEGSSPRVVIATLRNQSPALVQIAQQISRQLHGKSDQVIIIDHPDVMAHIQTANTFEAHVYVGIDCGNEAEHVVAYYETPTFISQGGKSLAKRIADELGASGAQTVRSIGMRLPVLRETRMPAVVCTLGNSVTLIENQKIVAQALARAIGIWVSAIVAGSPESPTTPRS
jgi:N-acetylmuramoyl-L-alanine amidase